MAAHPHFFSCDWGTTSMRLRCAETATGRVLSTLEDARCGIRDVAASLPKNASATERAQHFADLLARQISRLPRSAPALHAASPVVLSGMASSSIGWMELPYATVPFPVDGSTARCAWLKVTVSGQTLPVLLVSGLATKTEMLRGEETHLVGLLAQGPFADWAGDSVVLLPGTHSKHVRLRDGNIVDLRTFMTGELFDVLSHHSVLQFTTQADASPLNENAFLEGLQSAENPGLMPSLFQVRTRGVLRGLPAAANRDYLSGLLVGAELRALTDPTQAPRILLAAAAGLATLYQQAAHHLNLLPRLQVVSPHELQQAVVKGQARLLETFRQ